MSRPPIPDGVRLTFRPERAVVHELVDLVDAERACCGWASWTISASQEATVVDVTALGEAADRLRALFDVAP